MGQVLPLRPPEGSAEDIERERTIRRLTDELKRALKGGPWAVSKAIELQQQMTAEVLARSPEQVRRMEKARGLAR